MRLRVATDGVASPMGDNGYTTSVSNSIPASPGFGGATNTTPAFGSTNTGGSLFGGGTSGGFGGGGTSKLCASLSRRLACLDIALDSAHTVCSSTIPLLAMHRLHCDA